jgi:chemotaxis protein CheD
MQNNVAVGLGEIKISDDPNTVLVAFGLGSCVGIGIYDPIKKMGGMLHAVLPKANGPNDDTPGKYVDSGIKLLLENLKNNGLNLGRSNLYLIGGANILLTNKESTPFDIGTRNVKTAEDVLDALKLKPLARDTGGHNGRTFRLYIGEGRATIRTMGEKEKDI